MKTTPLITSGIITLFGTTSVVHAESKTVFDLEANAELVSDSNVSVSDIDSTTNASDIARAVQLKAGVTTDFASGTRLKAGYSIRDKAYDEFTSFDLRSQIASVGVRRDVGDWKIGGDYRYVAAALDGDSYLSMHQVSPYATKFVTKKLFARADYTYSDKSFDGRPTRDATVHAMGADLYYFVNDGKTYAQFGADYEASDAVDDALSFDGVSVKAGLSHKIKILEKKARLKTGWRYEDRSYEDISPSIGDQRSDQRHRFDASIEIDVNKNIYVAAEYEYGDFSSNLESVDYTQNVVGIRLGFKR